MAGWNSDTAAGPLGVGSVTLVEGSSFCISSPNGDIHADRPHGLFVADIRIVSVMTLAVDGQALEPLTAEVKEPYRAVFVGRVPRTGGYADSPLIVERLREVGTGLQERLTIHNYSPDAAECVVTVDVEADFADLFEVKEARIGRPWQETRENDGGTLTIRGSWGDLRKGVVVHAPGGDISGEAIVYRTSVPAHGDWTATLTVLPVDGTGAAPVFAHSEADGLSPRDRRRREWVAKIPVLHVGNRSVERTLRRSHDDLGALRIEDPNHPERVVVAAGAPWFMALFGRDSLWASVMALPVDPSLALGTLQTLAERQGTVVDPITEEEPGKILHEVRLDVSRGLSLGASQTITAVSTLLPCS